MRCTATVNQIRRLRLELEFDWATLLLRLPATPTAIDIEPFLNRARGASVALSEVLTSETEEWRHNFEKSFSDIETVLKLDQAKRSSAWNVPSAMSERTIQSSKPTNGGVRRR